jgi:hypothetical protein
VTLIGVGVGGGAGVTGIGPVGVGLDTPAPEWLGRPGAVVAGEKGAGSPLAALLRGGAI